MQLKEFDLNSVEFFEGTEKLLELWFKLPDEYAGDRLGLRKIPRHQLDTLLDHVKAEIVSHSRNEFMDSYVLSESSMFISSNKFIIKTCGSTHLLACIKPLINLAKQYAKIDGISNIYYSRRVYLKPELQDKGHQTFQQEVNFLKQMFPSGSSHILGQTKGQEWHLFTAESIHETLPQPDATLEILMSELDENTMKQFTKARHPKSEEMTKATGISDLIPESSHDGLAFDPCGYSMNGLLDKSYHTIHITPQPRCSYVSFETNLQQDDYSELVNKVLQTFKPGKFIITLFANKYALCGPARSAMEKMKFKGFQCVDLEDSFLKNYTLTYGHFQSVY